MLLADNILAQKNDMVYVDKYHFENQVLISNPKFETLEEDSPIPVSMWIESICQNGEIYCREIFGTLSQVILADMRGIQYYKIAKKDISKLKFFTRKAYAAKHFFKSQIVVVFAGSELFCCDCTHYFKE